MMTSRQKKEFLMRCMAYQLHKHNDISCLIKIKPLKQNDRTKNRDKEAREVPNGAIIPIRKGIRG